jgi:hypothetical protein
LKQLFQTWYSAQVPSKFDPSLIDRVNGLYSKGETARSIEAILREEGIDISYPTIHRMRAKNGTAKPKVLVGAPRVPIPRPRPPKPEPAPTPTVFEGLPPEEAEIPIEIEVLEEPIDLPDDPRQLAKDDWQYYERLKIRLRRQADRELQKNNLRHYRDLLREARVAEERAQELRPPVPPDPNSDPSYLAAARDLVAYVEALVSRAERGEAVPPRSLAPIEPMV